MAFVNTNTDKFWKDRLASIEPAYFGSNMSTSPENLTGWLNTMVDKIGRIVVSPTDTVFNPFARFNAPIMNFGAIEEFDKVKYITPIKYENTLSSNTWGADGVDPFKIYKNPPVVMYAKINDSVQYPLTIHDYEISKAFHSESEFGSFISAQYGAIQESNTLDMRTKWKKFLSMYVNNSNPDSGMTNNCYTETIDVASDTYAEDLIHKIRVLEQNFREPSSTYNRAGDTAISNDTVAFIRRSDFITMSEYLSGVYNLEQIGLLSDIILIDDFATPSNSSTVNPTSGNQISAIVCDSRALRYTPREVRGTSQYNAKGLYTNTFLTIEGIYSIATYRNFAAITFNTA